MHSLETILKMNGQNEFLAYQSGYFVKKPYGVVYVPAQFSESELLEEDRKGKDGIPPLIAAREVTNTLIRKCRAAGLSETSIYFLVQARDGFRMDYVKYTEREDSQIK